MPIRKGLEEHGEEKEALERMSSRCIGILGVLPPFRRKRGRQRIRWLDSITDSKDVSLSQLQEMGKDRAAWRASVHGSQRVGRD